MENKVWGSCSGTGESLFVDISKDEIAQYGDDDEYVYERGGVEDGIEELVIGGLKIKMTNEQMIKVRYFFENT